MRIMRIKGQNMQSKSMRVKFWDFSHRKYLKRLKKIITIDTITRIFVFLTTCRKNHNALIEIIQMRVTDSNVLCIYSGMAKCAE